MDIAVIDIVREFYETFDTPRARFQKNKFILCINVIVIKINFIARKKSVVLKNLNSTDTGLFIVRYQG